MLLTEVRLLSVFRDDVSFDLGLVASTLDFFLRGPLLEVVVAVVPRSPAVFAPLAACDGLAVSLRLGFDTLDLVVTGLPPSTAGFGRVGAGRLSSLV